MVWLIYLVGIVDGLIEVCAAIGILSFVGWVVTTAYIHVCGYEGVDEACVAVWKKARKVTWLFIPLALIATFTPSSKTIAAMYLVPKIANNEQVQQIPNKALDVLNLKLDEWIKDLSKEK